MRKGILSLCCIAALSTSSFAAEDMMKQLELLKAQIAQLEAQIKAQTDKNVKLEDGLKQQEEKIVKVEKRVETTNKTVNQVKAHDAGDNIKWDVDFRTQADNIEYKHASGATSKNNALLTNRLWLNMKYQGDENSSFFGTLSYNKAYGDTANHSQSNTQPAYANFDWVTNENATDNTLKVKEAFWLYSNDSFLGNGDVPWTASVGRRPSTDGLAINLRSDQERKSPLSHTVNVEFDGVSAKFDLDKITGVPGMWWKFCAGRGLTNAKPRFQMNGADYAEDTTKNPNTDMAGFIFVPYDDGQYSVHTNYAKAWNLIGYTNAQLGAYQTAMNAATTASDYMNANSNLQFKDVGDIEFATAMFKAYGIGNGISDFLDETTFFASYAMSKTSPNANGMLGTTDGKTGDSYWIGLNMPDFFTEKAKFGVEWNQGSKYWRSMTYGEDTFAGSKISTRGQAWEIYRNQQLTDALSFSISYTLMKYDYTGSNSFFGAEGTPMTMSQAVASGSDPVQEAQDIKAYIRYRF